MASATLTCLLLICCIGALNAYHNVAFSAAKSGYQRYSKRMVYNVQYLNTGRAYNRHNGIMTAPKCGLYTFTYNFLTYPRKSVNMYLYKNRVIVSRSYAYNRYGYANGGNTVNLYLRRGDKVYTKNSGKVYGGYYATFSGHLISSYHVAEGKEETSDETPEQMDHAAEGKEETSDETPEQMEESQE